MLSESADVVTCEVRVNARPETIFPFLTEPERILQWKGIEASIDARPGGIYRVNVNGRDIARGEYVEIVPPSRVVFTWGWEGEGSPLPPGSSRVEIRLVPDGDGTIVRLSHSGLPEPLRPRHGEGWRHFLSRLAVVAAGGDPGPDPFAKAT